MTYTPSTFAGMRVFISRPTLKTVRRSWRERLLTWPWRPWVVSREIVIPALIPTDDIVCIGDDLHCGELAYQKLMRAITPN